MNTKRDLLERFVGQQVFIHASTGWSIVYTEGLLRRAVGLSPDKQYTMWVVEDGHHLFYFDERQLSHVFPAIDGAPIFEVDMMPIKEES